MIYILTQNFIFLSPKVEEGEELTDMYTVHWTEYTLEERREYLDRVFHFLCTCNACW